MGSWGELTVGLCGTLTWTVPGLAGEVGCVRGQALPSMEGATELSRRIFPKRKKPSGNYGEFPCSNSSSLLRTPPLVRALYASTGECPHLILEGAETTGTNWGRVPSDRENGQ